jgi:hypothetical protein
MIKNDFNTQNNAVIKIVKRIFNNKTYSFEYSCKYYDLERNYFKISHF